MNKYFEFTKYPKNAHKYDPKENQIFVDQKLIQKNNSELTVLSRESLEVKGNLLGKQKRQNSAETLKLQKDSYLSKKSNVRQSHNVRQTSQEESFEMENKHQEDNMSNANSERLKPNMDYKPSSSVGFQGGYRNEVHSKLNNLMQSQEKRIPQRPYFL